jgi:hypothetical protein
MVRSLQAMRALACTDPAAAESIGVLRRRADELDAVWLPLVRRTLDLADRSSVPADLAALDNALAYVMVRSYGWSAAIDPLGDGAGVTGEEARALGARMNRLDATEVAENPAELAWLAGRLELIACDPQLSVQFLANFHEWGPWADALGRQRALHPLVAHPRVTIGELDGVFAGLAHIQRVVLPGLWTTTDLLSLLPWIDEMSPYSAAAIVRHLDLHGNDLAAVSDLLLHRVRAVHAQDASAPAADLDALPGPGTAELLAPLLLADRAATTEFLRFTVADPSLLLESFDNTADAYAFLLQATDPERMSAAAAGEVLPPIIDSFRNDRQLPEWRCFLVDLVAPWTLQFSPENHEWLLSTERRNDLLSFVLDDDAALRRFIEQADRVAAGVTTSFRSGARYPYEELGAYMAMIGELVVNARVQNADEQSRAWKMVATLAGLMTSVLPGVAIAAGISLAIVIVNESTGPDPKLAARQAGYGADLAATTAGAAVAYQIATQWKADGSLPPDYPMPPAADPNAKFPSQRFLWAFTSWRDNLPGGDWGPMADHVTAAVFAFVNPPLMGAHSVTLFMP